MDDRRIARALDAPVDAASLAVFRAGFGAVMLATTVRFAAHGWIAREFERPTFFFPYWGFSWIHPLPGDGMTALYVLMGVTALAITVGLFTRAAALLFGLAFTFAHLCDKTNYLNHYYLVSLLSLLLVIAPLDRAFSFRVVLWPEDRADRVRRWVLWLFRLQVGVVYVFGGLAKLGSDWLLRGEPLRIWLSTRRDLPLLGRFLADPRAAIAFSWGGLLFDLSVVPLLLWARTRRIEYAVVLFFHAMTAVLFNIGMFPWIMSVAATVLFDPSWPRRFWRARPHAEGEAVAGAPVRAAGLAALVAYALVQLLLPLRHLLYPGNTLWTEEGFRFSWRVMLIEKQGALEYTVVEPDGRRTVVSPRESLTPFQTQMTATQPDMILQFAHHLADAWAAKGRGPVKVFADAQVSFNGRPHQRMVDPSVDLAAEKDGLWHKRWILPAPTVAPLF